MINVASRAKPYRYIRNVSEPWQILKRALGRALYVGRAVYCPVCERHFRAWRGDSCPACRSLTRQRLAALTIDRLVASGEIGPGQPMLYFAPDPGMMRFLASRGISFTTSDLSAPNVDLIADATDLPIPDGAYRAILSSHVLEHVPDDRLAMREMARVLDDRGVAIIQVPVVQERDATDEDPAVTDPEERNRRFGQPDHVRTYGMDIVDRLTAAGFEVEVSRPVAAMTWAAAAWLGVWPDILFICRKCIGD